MQHSHGRWDIHHTNGLMFSKKNQGGIPHEEYAVLNLMQSVNSNGSSANYLYQPDQNGMNKYETASSRITVVIVNYNGGEMIIESLQALRRQTFRDFSIVVVDNHSGDGSSERIAADFPEVVLFALKENIGFAAGNNFALQHGPLAEWIVLLNPDAFPRSDWLACLLRTAELNPDFDIFGSRLCSDSDGMVLDGIGDAYHVSGLVWREAHGCRTAARYLEKQEIFSPCAAAAMYRSRPLIEVGGFDDDLFCYVEDVDLGFRLRLAGYRSLYVPDAVVQHLGSGVVGIHSDFQIYHGHRNVVWVYVKDMPSVLFWALLPLHIAMNMAGIVWFTLRGQGRVILRAKWDAIKGIPKFWRKRDAIQSARRISTWMILRSLAWNPFKNNS